MRRSQHSFAGILVTPRSNDQRAFKTQSMTGFGAKPKSTGSAGGGPQLGVELKQPGCSRQGGRQSARDPGCVKTLKGRTLRGILFCWNQVFAIPCERSPLSLGTPRTIILEALCAPAFPHGHDPLADIFDDAQLTWMNELAARIVGHYERHAIAWDADRRRGDWELVWTMSAYDRRVSGVISA